MTAPFDLETEVRDLAARRDITDAIHRYARGLDRLEPETQRSAFHDGAHIDAGLAKGDPDEFVAFCQDFLGSMEGSQHILGQSQIAIHDERTASGETYFQAWHGLRNDAGQARAQFVSGRYVDEFECREGDWRITSRYLITDWVVEMDLDEEFFTSNPGMYRGGRRGTDVSQLPGRKPQGD